MIRRRFPIRFAAVLVSCFVLLGCSSASRTGELHIAVASNFREPAAELSARFEELSGKKVSLTFGSTGKLYSQIRTGAPFAVLLAADAERPELLEDEIAAAAGTRFTYAVGKLVLWSPVTGVVDGEGKVLFSEFGKLAVANPALAPYGKAAEEVLRKKGLWERVQSRLVRGESIGQTFHFVSTGNAEIGFVALSQVKGVGGSFWEVPEDLYSPIEQQAVLLRDDEGAREFLKFLKSEEAGKAILGYGYGIR